MDDKYFEVLFTLANKLNQSNITWAIGASMMLKLRDIDVNVHDIDIMVIQDDFERACKNINEISDEVSVDESSIFKTKQFKRFVCNGIEIDIMTGMGITHRLDIFDFRFTKNDIEKTVNINTIKLPLCYIEDWYVFYQIMPNRMSTIQKIEHYFNEYNFDSTRFSTLLELSIPFYIHQIITKLIENKK